MAKTRSPIERRPVDESVRKEKSRLEEGADRGQGASLWKREKGAGGLQS